MGILTGVVIVLALFLSIFSLISFAKPRKKPTDRLDSWMNTYQEPENSEEKPPKESLIHILGSQAERVGIGKRYSEKTKIKLMQADLPLTGYEFNILRAFVGLVLGAILALLTRTPLMVGLAMAGVWMLSNLYLVQLKNKRMKMFSNQLGDALTLFANSLRAGFSFLQAISSVAREMPDPISKEFTRLLKEMSLGLSMEKSLQNMLLRMPLDDLELLVIAILIQKEIGGNLAEIIDTIASTIRERITIQREIKTLTAQGRLSGYVVGGIPIFLAGVMFFINPAYISTLFMEPAGRVMIGFGIFSMMMGIFFISKIVNIEV